jgi:hypothetical protein
MKTNLAFFERCGGLCVASCERRFGRVHAQPPCAGKAWRRAFRDFLRGRGSISVRAGRGAAALIRL